MNLFYKITRILGLLIILWGIIMFIYNLSVSYYGVDVLAIVETIGDLVIFLLIGLSFFRLNKWIILGFSILGIVLFVTLIINLIFFGNFAYEFITRIVWGILGIYFIRNRKYLIDKASTSSYLKSKKFYEI